MHHALSQERYARLSLDLSTDVPVTELWWISAHSSALSEASAEHLTHVLSAFASNL